MNDAVWITWENHRRSYEIAKELGVKIVILASNLPQGLRQLFLSSKTLYIITKIRPKMLFVQNPSRILAFWAVLISKLLNIRVVVDRHTNFRIGKKIGLNPAILIITFLSNISLKYADLTIVSNMHLKPFVVKKGGRCFVLPDKIPSLHSNFNDCVTMKGRKNLVYICSFDNDEPYDEVIKASTYLPDDVCIYITGNYKKKITPHQMNLNKSCCIFTGFVDENIYVKILQSCDAVIALTNSENCLLCGGYEAISLEKPLITTGKQAIKEYFKESVVYTKNDAKDIACSIEKIIKKEKIFKERIIELKKQKQAEWDIMFRSLLKEIGSPPFCTKKRSRTESI
jgi:hypothetical protein